MQEMAIQLKLVSFGTYFEFLDLWRHHSQLVTCLPSYYLATGSGQKVHITLQGHPDQLMLSAEKGHLTLSDHILDICL